MVLNLYSQSCVGVVSGSEVKALSLNSLNGGNYTTPLAKSIYKIGNNK